MSIVATASVADFFEEVVEDAMKARGVNASEGATSYLVALLAELAKPGSPVERTLDRPLTLLLDEALHTDELAERFDKLRTLGDGVLYSSGFFADHFEARGVDTKYVISIGRTAYESAGSLLRTGSERDVEKSGSTSSASSRRTSRASSRCSREVANATVAKGVADVARRAQALRAMAQDAQRAARRGARVAGLRRAARRRPGPLVTTERTNERALEGNGVGLVREIALAGRIQRGLETLYRLDRARRRRRVRHARRRGRARGAPRARIGGRPRAPAPHPAARGCVRRRRRSEPRSALPDHRGRQSLRLPRRPRVARTRGDAARARAAGRGRQVRHPRVGAA